VHMNCTNRRHVCEGIERSVEVLFLLQVEIVAVHIVDFHAGILERCHNLECAKKLFMCTAETKANHCCVI